MQYIKNLFASLVKDEEGGHMVEYTLVAVLVALACIIGFGALGTAVNDKAQNIGDYISTHGNPQ